RYLPHAHACITLIDNYGLLHIDATELFYHAGRWQHEHAQYQEAELFYQRALSMKEQKNDQTHLGLTKILDSLAWLYLDQGAHQRAASLFQRALTIKRQSLGPEHPEIAITLHALGRLHHAQEEFLQAE